MRVPAIVQQRLWRRALGEEASAALLDPDAAASLAGQARQIGIGWRCLDEPGDYLSLDQQAWRRWADRYAARCDAENLIDDSALGDHVAELLQSDEHALCLPRHLYLAGFLQLTPQQQTVLDAVQAVGVSVDALPAGPRGEVRCDVHADDDAEMRAVAEEVRVTLEAEPGLNLGVVIADLGQRRAQVLRAFDRAFFPGLSPAEISSRGRPYDLSLGLPLADQAVVRTALSLLRLTQSAVSGGELSALLLSPYIAGAARERRFRERLDRRLREQGVRRVSLITLCESLGDASELSSAGRRLLGGRQVAPDLPSVWAARFADSLDQLGWPGRSNDSEEHQTIQAWHECLQDLQRLDDGERIDEREALRAIVRLARERVFQPETPAVPIQIMGRLESHGIAFDRLWVTGLDAEQWPPVGSASPFLPMARQKAAGVPEASVPARLALAEREFAQWQASTPMLIASHVGERDGNPLSPAAVLREAGPLNRNVIARDDSPIEQVMRATVLTSVVDTHGPPLPAGESVPGGARLFEDQALCPFRAFALHRLQVRPLEEVGLGLDPREHGNLLHDALEAFWTTTRNHAALLALDEAALRAAIDDAVEVALASADTEGRLSASLRELEQRRLVRLVMEWIERCERPRAPFDVVEMESSAEIEHGGIRMQVRLDRIDRVGDARVVLDYKTGTGNRISSWSDRRITNPQLPLYVLTDPAIEGVAFAQVARHDCQFRGVASDAALLPRVGVASGEIGNWADWRRHWSTALDGVAAEIRAGDARVAPLPKACQYCDLKSLCRIDASMLAGDDDAASDAIDGTEGAGEALGEAGGFEAGSER